MKISILGSNGVGKTPLARQMKLELKAQGIKVRRVRCPYFPGIFSKSIEDFLRPRFKQGFGFHSLFLFIAVPLFQLLTIFWKSKTQIWEHDPSVEILAYGKLYNSKILIFFGKLAQKFFTKADFYIFVQKSNYEKTEKRYRKRNWSEERIQQKIEALKRFEQILLDSIPKHSLVIKLQSNQTPPKTRKASFF